MPNRPIVAPFVGAWIETSEGKKLYKLHKVAPFVGAWIETCLYGNTSPSAVVAPFVGAWIETQASLSQALSSQRRSLRGSVD